MTIQITIKCPVDGTTQISYTGQKQFTHYRHQPSRESIIRKLINQAHYNDVFSITPILTDDSESERAHAEVQTFKRALKKAFASVPELNLSIEAEPTPEKVAYKAATNEEQLAILKEAVLVAEKIRYYPRKVPQAILNAPPGQFSAEALLQAKKTVEEAHDFVKNDFLGSYDFASNSKLKNALIFFTAYKNQDYPMPPISFLTFILGLTTLLLAIVGVGSFPVLLGVAIPALLIAIGGLIIPPLLQRHFNAKTGCADMSEKLLKISPDFLKSLADNAPESTLSKTPSPLTQSPILGYTPTSEILQNLASVPDAEKTSFKKTPKK